MKKPLNFRFDPSNPCRLCADVAILACDFKGKLPPGVVAFYQGDLPGADMAEAIGLALAEQHFLHQTQLDAKQLFPRKIVLVSDDPARQESEALALEAQSLLGKTSMDFPPIIRISASELEHAATALLPEECAAFDQKFADDLARRPEAESVTRKFLGEVIPDRIDALDAPGDPGEGSPFDLARCALEAASTQTPTLLVTDIPSHTLTSGYLLNGMARGKLVLPVGICRAKDLMLLLPAIAESVRDALPVKYLVEEPAEGIAPELFAILRSFAGIEIYRPGDGRESIDATHAMLTSDAPAVLLASAATLPPLAAAGKAKKSGAMQGAYILKDSRNFDLLLMASGTETRAALATAKALAKLHCKTRVVSMVSQERFLDQPSEYRDKVLPPEAAGRISMENGGTLSWSEFVGDSGLALGREIVTEKADFSTDAVIAEISRHFVGDEEDEEDCDCAEEHDHEHEHASGCTCRNCRK
ncbi:MAG: hypothetical protein PHS41_04555 [Victivallaceae bacterium]|nr:hypothetical protein [Victivallaceae bacterium]